MNNTINGRKSGGFSLRRALIEDQGVTLEDDVRRHLATVHGTLLVNPRLDITRYRASQQSA